jgi:hypothetical protein
MHHHLFWDVRLMRPKRFVPVCLVQSQQSEFSSAFTKVSSGTVSFRSIALLPLLLPHTQSASTVGIHVDFSPPRTVLWHLEPRVYATALQPGLVSVIRTILTIRRVCPNFRSLPDLRKQRG